MVRRFLVLPYIEDNHGVTARKVRLVRYGAMLMDLQADLPCGSHSHLPLVVLVASLQYGVVELKIQIEDWNTMVLYK